MMKRLLVPALLLAYAVGTAKAGPVGSLGFSDIGTPEAGGSPAGDINTATSFTIGDLFSTKAETGIFVGLPHQDFGSVTFSTLTPTSFSFSNSVFGTFTSTSIIEAVNSPGIVAFNILGNYTAGSIDPGSGTNPASFTLSFTQTPIDTGSISDSGTFSINTVSPPTVPEPATLVMGLTSFVGAGLLFHLVRRQRSRKATR
jgi:hypothetical protein